MKNCLLAVLLVFFYNSIVFGQYPGKDSLNQKSKDLDEFAIQKQKEWQKNKRFADSIFNVMGYETRGENKLGTIHELQRFTNGSPVFYITDNQNASTTISANDVCEIQIHQIPVNGYGTSGLIWDGGAVRSDHQEFLSGEATRIIQRDNPSSISDHSTHISGTMVAAGIDHMSTGMSPMAKIYAYDFNNDRAELASEANDGSMLSNHSYGTLCGWRYDLNNEIWYWHGDYSVSATEDVKFGLYDEISQEVDYILWNAPRYVFIKSAGNERNDGPESQPVEHLLWDGAWITSTVIHEKDGGTDGYDCLSSMAVAKNVISVGSVKDLEDGYINAAGVVMEDYSSWGPTDDGRIKPDIVANGENIYSTIATGTDSYASVSGTSMAAASISGSVLLLHQAQGLLQAGVFLNSSTIKGLLIHTADECGNANGPDYKYGWGLANIEKAVNLLIDNADNGGKNIIESVLQNNGLDTIPVSVLPGTGNLKASICWTDPPATPPGYTLNPLDKMLINDLDIKIRQVITGNEYFPWVLNPSSPEDNAIQGVNSTDNVEQVVLYNPDPGNYEVIVTHKGSLYQDNQSYSLIVSGTETTKGIVPPSSLVYSSGDKFVKLLFNSSGNTDCIGYNIYRQDYLLTSTIDTFFYDSNVENDIEFEYYVTAIYPDNQESIPTNTVIAKPQKPRTLPYTANFEASDEEWTIKHSISGWRYGDSDSLSSYYLNFSSNDGKFLAVDSYTAGKGIHTSDIAQTPPIDLSNCENVHISFDYLLRSGMYGAIDELKLVYKTAGNSQWSFLDNLPVALSWTSWERDLPLGIQDENVIFGLYYDDLYMWGFGAAIDNFTITGNCETDTVIDIVPLEIKAPTTQCILSSEEKIILYLKNRGEYVLEEGKHIEVSLAINNLLVSIYTIIPEAPLYPDSALSFTFPEEFDFSSDGEYTIQITAYCTDYTDYRDDTLTVIIENLENPQPEISGLEDQYCLTNDTILLTGFPSGGTFSGSGVDGNSLFLSALSPGIITISYEYSDVNYCTGKTIHDVTLNQLPLVSIFMPDTTICANSDPLSITYTPLGGELLGQGLISDVFYPGLDLPDINLITYNYTDENNCSNSDTLKIDILESTDIKITNNDTSICQNSSKLYLETQPSGGAFNDAKIIDNFFYPENYLPGKQDVIYSLVNEYNCTSSDTIEIEVLAPPEVVILNNDDTFCSNDAAVIISVSPEGGWFDGPGLIDNVFTPNSTVPGNYIISYTYTAENTCTGSDTVHIEILEIPDIKIDNIVDTLCYSSPAIELSGIPSDGEWFGTGIIGSSFYPDSEMSGTYEIFYKIEDQHGCTSVDSVEIYVTPQKAIEFSTEEIEVCRDAQYIILEAFPGGGTFSGTGVEYSIFKPEMAGIGKHIVYYTLDDLCNIDSISAEVFPLPEVLILNSDTAICSNTDPLFITYSPSGGVLSGDGLLNDIFYPGSGLPEANLITYHYTDENNCSNSDSLMINILESTDISLSCEFENICSDFDPIPVLVKPTGGILSGNGIIENFFYPEIADNGSNTIIYSLTNENGCTTVDSLHVFVSDWKEIVFNPVNDPLCDNSAPVMLEASPSGGTFYGSGVTDEYFIPQFAGIGTHTVYYDLGDGCSMDSIYFEVLPTTDANIINSDTSVCHNSSKIFIETQPSGGAFNDRKIIDNFFYPENYLPGNQNIIYSFVNAYNCISSDTIEIEVLALPEVVILNEDDSFCINDDPVIITVSPEGGWFEGPGLIDNVCYPSLAEPGNHIISYSYTAENTCNDVAYYSFSVNPFPELFLGQDTSILVDSCLHILPITDAQNFLWNNGSVDSEFIFCGTEQTLGENMVFLDVWNEWGCIHSDSIHIYVKEDIGISDTKNDKKGLSIYPNPGSHRIKILIHDSQRIRKIDIMDTSGKYVRIPGEFEGEYLDIDFLDPGLYYLRIYMEKSVHVKKFIKI